MADYEAQSLIPKETALQALNTIIQLHFEKTLEKKRAVDLQKKELWKLFQLFFLFLAVVFAAQSISPRLQCRHCWVPIAILSLANLIFYVSVAQTLRCINGFKYQRRCHKLTFGLATERLRQLKIRLSRAPPAPERMRREMQALEREIREDELARTEREEKSWSIDEKINHQLKELDALSVESNQLLKRYCSLVL